MAKKPTKSVSRSKFEKMDLKEAMKAYTQWTKENEGTLVGKRLTKQELQNRLDEDFGDQDKGVYKRALVFSCEEDKAAYIESRS